MLHGEKEVKMGKAVLLIVYICAVIMHILEICGCIHTQIHKHIHVRVRILASNLS